MSNLKIVFDSPGKWDYIFLKRYVKKKVPVWVIEPFHAFHHRNRIRFFPKPLPEFVTDMVKDKKINVLTANQINAREIYQLAAEKAISVVEAVFHEYKKEHEEFITYVSDALKSPIAEYAFKKHLCDKLAEFYSVNILLYRIESMFVPEQVMVYTDTNVNSYNYFRSLLSKSRQDFFEHPHISFPAEAKKAAVFEDMKEYAVALSRLIAQTVGSSLFSVFSFSTEKKKKEYSYGISIISPGRQLSDNRRGPDFIIDNNKIRQHDVVYLPLTDLSNIQKKQLSEVPGDVHYPPKTGRCFSCFTQWAGLLRAALKKNIFCNGNEVNVACNVLFNYFRWQKVLRDVKLRHFITHCDFGISHIGRNIALNQAGVQTWYFTDSMNFSYCMEVKEEQCKMRHPFWTYLYYDHFVTWDELLAQYYKGHPGPFKQTHVVGCLWSGHIEKIKGRENSSTKYTEKSEDRFALAVFDTTYTRNGFTSYAEGIEFAEHILRLADDYPDVHIFLKEKKQRGIHKTLDPMLGPRLLDIYRRMDSHPRITTCSDREDASELIAISDMVISFPFTSTTFEALSANKPAVWHDPMGYYRNTPYGEVRGVMTHSYEELKSKVLEIKSMEQGTYQNPFPADSPLMDPYRDGKAIERFRELLCSQGEKVKQYTHSACATKNE